MLLFKKLFVNRAIVWFRQDLRLSDNEAIHDALKHADEVLYVYVFEDLFLKSNGPHGFRRTGKHRLKFIIESVEDLRLNLRSKGADLIIRCGKAQDEIFKLAKQYKSSWVFCNRERTSDEVKIQDKLEQNLWSVGQEIKYSRGKMLYYTQDLPFPITHTPDIFTNYRKEVEKITPVRKPIPEAENYKYAAKDIESGEIPTLEDYGFEQIPSISYSAFPLKGGETAGLDRLRYYLWDSRLIDTYLDTRNELVGVDYSSKFSPYLAQGCLSPKVIYHEIMKYEQFYGGNKSTYWLYFELLWRDFFRLIAKKYQNAIFQPNGLKGGRIKEFKEDQKKITDWTQGTTGQTFVDANMIELNATGFMSNRGRQNVASYLVHDLKQNWQIGAEYFEYMLIDYDVCSNWGNWNYLAGVGNDPRENRVFNLETQARRYDPENKYVDLWRKFEKV